MKFDSIRFLIYKNEPLTAQMTKDPVILLNMDGLLKVELSGKLYTLKKGDLMLVNPLSEFSCQPVDSLYLAFHIDKDKAQECFDNRSYLFECNSSLEVTTKYDRLRKILYDIVVSTYQNNQYFYIQMNQLFYELIVELLRNFSVQLYGDDIDRRRELMEYVEIHYQEDLTLQEAADAFHMSRHYFSKYFKKQVEVPYYQYLTEVRLKHALYDVENTDKKLLQVAMDNGFSNLSSFNHYFKEKYQVGPKEYRLANRKTRDEKTYAKDLKSVIDRMNLKDAAGEQIIKAHMDSNQPTEIYPYWNELLNFGQLHYLDDAQIIDQLKMVQAEVHYRYLRIQLEEKAYLDNNHSLSKEERWFDQIMDMGLMPWIVIDFRKIKEPDLICEYLRNLLSHFANRYSILNVRKWRLECVYNTLFDEEKLDAFISCFLRIQSILDNLRMNQGLMAAGLTLGNRAGIRTYFEYLDRHDIVIENQTFQVAPYIYYENEEGLFVSRPNENVNIHQDLLNLAELAPYYGKHVKNTYIVSWRNDLNPINIINDSCQKGALIMKQSLSCLGQIQGLSVDIPFDAMYDEKVQERVLFGGAGLVSYQGIHKPSFYAFSFMARSSRVALFKNENVLFTKNEFGNYHVICHNCKELSHKYYMEREYLSYDKLSEYFEDDKALTLHIRIEHVENGTYILKKRSISQKGGSVQDELHRMVEGDYAYIHPHDIEFLESIAIPQINIMSIQVENEVLETTIDISANEISFLHLIHQY